MTAGGRSVILACTLAPKFDQGLVFSRVSAHLAKNAEPFQKISSSQSRKDQPTRPEMKSLLSCNQKTAYMHRTSRQEYLSRTSKQLKGISSVADRQQDKSDMSRHQGHSERRQPSEVTHHNGASVVSCQILHCPNENIEALQNSPASDFGETAECLSILSRTLAALTRFWLC